MSVNPLAAASSKPAFFNAAKFGQKAPLTAARSFNTAMPSALDQDVQQLKKALATPGSRPRNCITWLLEMFSWGAMFSLADSFMDTLLGLLGHVFSNLGEVIGNIF